jgi:hypothetical protein
MISRRNLFVGAALLVGLSALVACEDKPMASAKHHYTATLNAASEVPPVVSNGTGSADIWYDTSTKTLSWTVTFSGLTGPATMAHFHGPAAPGVNAGVVVPIGAAGMTSPATGNKVLTDAQAADMAAGKWYVNVHTAKNPGGEIRGQVVPAK